MPASMQPLRDEHDELLPWLDNLVITADRIGEAPFDTVREMIDEIYEFLVAHLIPHAKAEDESLYPAVERVMGAPGATATMSRDHVEVARLTEELGRYRAQFLGHPPVDLNSNGLRRILYGMYALIKLHFAKEEEILVPVLESGLTDDEAAEMFAGMEQAAKSARAKALETVHPGSRTLTV